MTCLKAWGLLSKEAFPLDALRCLCLDNLVVVLFGAKGARNTPAPLLCISPMETEEYLRHVGHLYSKRQGFSVGIRFEKCHSKEFLSFCPGGNEQRLNSLTFRV